MNKEKYLFKVVKEQLLMRYPRGWGGVAGILVDSGEILIGISPEFPNAGSSVCMELGAMLEAAKLNKTVTHTLCLVRENENSPLTILSPCGICQERLNLWGENVLCALTTKNLSDIKFAKLSELQPHHWSKAYEAIV